MRGYLLLILTVCIMLNGCASNKIYEESIYNASGVWSNFKYEGPNTFDQNIEELRKDLTITWHDRKKKSQYTVHSYANVDEIVNYLVPNDGAPVTACEGYSKGVVLLLHGLYDSPYIMKDLAQYFNTNCFTTRSLLLPGHGTVPGDLRHNHFSEWIDAVSYTIEQIKYKYRGENILLAGFSTGAGLALNHAIEHPSDVKAMFLFAPLVKVSGLNVFGSYVFEAIGEYVQKNEEVDTFKYESVTANSVIQVNMLAESLRCKLQEKRNLDMPIFIAQAWNDYTLSAQEIVALYDDGLFGNKTSLLLYAPKPVSGFLNKDCDDPVTVDIEINGKVSCNSSFEYSNSGINATIDDYSHMSLTLSPTDLHYGINQKYRYCLHYKHEEFCKTRSKPDVCYGERKAFGGAHTSGKCPEDVTQIIRLTSNPRFNHLKTQLDYFLKANKL